MIWILPAIFVLVHTPQGDSVRSYEGQSQSPEIITMLLSGEGKTGEFISEKDYEMFLEAHKPLPSVPDPVKEQAILDAKDTKLTIEQRLEALIKATLP